MKRATLPSSTRPSTSKRCTGTTAVECGVGPSMGDLVLRFVQSNKNCHKLSLPWEESYVVVEVLRPGTYKLKTIDGEVFINAWNIEQLRCFYPSFTHTFPY